MVRHCGPRGAFGWYDTAAHAAPWRAKGAQGREGGRGGATVRQSLSPPWRPRLPAGPSMVSISVHDRLRAMGCEEWDGPERSATEGVRLSANDNQATTGLRFAPSHARGARRRHAGPLCRRRRLYKRGPPHLLQPRCHCRQTERGQCVPLPQRAVGGCGCTARPWPGVMNCRAMRITTSFAGRSVFPSGSSARSRTVGASRRG